MHILFPRPVPDHDEIDLHQFYGADWLDQGGVRVNFIASADGGASAGGRSEGLQTRGDNEVFAVLRDLADVVLVGASTAATEGYKPIEMSERRQAVRRNLGLSPAPATAVVSGSLQLDLSASLYQHATAQSPTIIITGPKADTGLLNDVIDLAAGEPVLRLLEAGAGASGVNLAGAVEHLRELGYQRILCEGGPRLFAAGVAAGSVTELCLTVSPMLVGPGAPRIVGGDAWTPGVQPGLHLKGLLTEEGALFCRYVLAPPVTPA